MNTPTKEQILNAAKAASAEEALRELFPEAFQSEYAMDVKDVLISAKCLNTFCTSASLDSQSIQILVESFNDQSKVVGLYFSIYNWGIIQSEDGVYESLKLIPKHK